MYELLEQLQKIQAFVEAGGVVLPWIAALTFAMWTLVFERFWYFKGALKRQTNAILDEWKARDERKSWAAHQIRRAMISQVNESIQQNMSMIKTLIALAPLLGLLGTVTGMITVFNVLAVTGGGEARAMASGVSAATIPTMAGMVAALSGVFANTYLTRRADLESALFEDHLTIEID